MGWYFLYTNEAHPGEHLPAHASFEDKVAAATRLRDEVGIRRTILVDDLAGTVHRAYGACPNMIYVIAKGGQVLYKGMWTSAERVAEFCERLDGFGRPGLVPFYTEQLEMRTPDREAFEKRLEVNGPRSVTEWNEAKRIWAERAKAEAKARRARS